MRSTTYLKAGAIGLLLLATGSPALADSQAVRLCRSYVQGRIDVLDAELHKGEKPNVARKLVKRRDRLRAQLAACDRNPSAYKKDI